MRYWVLPAVFGCFAVLWWMGPEPVEWYESAPIPSTVYQPREVELAAPPVAPVVSSSTVVVLEEPPVQPAPAEPPQPIRSLEVGWSVPADAYCPEWWVPASAAGWEPRLLPVLDEIIWRESRCLPGAVSSTNDYGLLQLNWSAHGDGYERAGLSRDDLLDPVLNLALGWDMFVAHEEASEFWCGFSPWYMSVPDRVDHWCQLHPDRPAGV